jgi:uncharacterized protein (DUF1697 family)
MIQFQKGELRLTGSSKDEDVATYVGLLRGVNVGGKNRIPMPELREVFADLGHEGVRTYVQSGNVVFDSRSTSPNEVAAGIEHAVSETFGLTISVLVRTRRELERVAGTNPFPTKDVAPTSLHVAFLADRPSAKAVRALDPKRSPPDEFVVRGREIYLRFPGGSARSKLTIDYFERALGTRATARNWNTVLKLLDMMRSAR